MSYFESEFDSAPVGTLFINVESGAALRVKAAPSHDFMGERPTQYAVHEDSAFGWGATGTVDVATVEEWRAAYADGSVVIAWKPVA